MERPKIGVKRVNFDLDDELQGRLYHVARTRKTTVSNRLREYVKLGLTADELALSGEGEVIVRYKNGRERGLLF